MEKSFPLVELPFRRAFKCSHVDIFWFILFQWAELELGLRLGLGLENRKNAALHPYFTVYGNILSIEHRQFREHP